MKMFSMIYVDKIRVNIGAGTIDRCVKQVIRLAKMLDCQVEFEFNDRLLIAYPDSEEKQLLEIYWKAIHS